MVDQDELRRRIRAARILAGVSQAEMNDKGDALGLRKHTLGAVERGDETAQHVHLAMLCEILDVPMSWFTEPREVIVAQTAADYAELVNELFALSQSGAEGEQRRLRFPRGRQPNPEAPPGKARRAR